MQCKPQLCTEHMVQSLQEDQKLLEAHAEHGNKWTEIARIVGGR